MPLKEPLYYHSGTNKRQGRSTYFPPRQEILTDDYMNHTADHDANQCAWQGVAE